MMMQRATANGSRDASVDRRGLELQTVRLTSNPLANKSSNALSFGAMRHKPGKIVDRDDSKLSVGSFDITISIAWVGREARC